MRSNKALDAAFGCPLDRHGNYNPAWALENLVRIDLPFPMRIAWEIESAVTRINVHRLLAGRFEGAFNCIWMYARSLMKSKCGYSHDTEFYDIQARKWLVMQNLDLFGGTFNCRPMRGLPTISNHAYGIAIDIDPTNHGLGNRTAKFPDWYVQCWEDAGFSWGGDWTRRRDSMHFERTEVR